MRLRLENVTFTKHTKINKRYWISGYIVNFSHDFEFGKSYLLTSLNEGQNEALAYLISGVVEAEYGSITLNDSPYTSEQRRKDAWLVRWDQIYRFGFFQQSPKNQIRHGIRKNPDLMMTEMDIMRQFDLTPACYTRLLRQFSHEGWRAHCAIGFANGKRIFCFPSMYLETVDTIRYRFTKTVEFLKSQGALILFPVLPYINMDGLVDEIVHTHREQNYSIEEHGTWIWKSSAHKDQYPIIKS